MKRTMGLDLAYGTKRKSKTFALMSAIRGEAGLNRRALPPVAQPRQRADANRR